MIMKSLVAYALLLLLLTVQTRTQARAQGTAFTYQGRLASGGSPANGCYDLTFTVFNASTNGLAVGGPLTNAAITISNGLFLTTLDFGPGVFTGLNCWLEIGVATNGHGPFSTLTPRQAILATPYATLAKSASNLLGLLPATQLSGTVPSSQLSGSIPAAQINGTLQLSQLPAAVVTNATQFAQPNFIYSSVYPVAARTDLNTEPGANLTISNFTARIAINPCQNIYDPQILLTAWGLNYQYPTQLPGCTWFLNLAIEYPSNTFYPVYAAGNSNIIYQSGATLLTDPGLFLDIPKAANAWLRVWGWSTNGPQTLQTGYLPSNAQGIGNNTAGTTYLGEWFYSNLGASGNNPPSGSLNGNNTANYTFGWSPQILGYSTANNSVGIIGDSVAQAPYSVSWAVHRSYLTEGLYGSVPIINGAISGSTFESWPENPQAIAVLSRYCRTIICQLGVNDDNQGLSTMTNKMVALWQDLKQRGNRVIQTTMTPHSSSTNGFATEAGQTAIFLGTHTNLNAWIRSQTYVPVLDVATNIESVSNPGCWKVIGGTNTTVDGLHPETQIAVWTLATCVSNNLYLFK
jgi:hypothetical protein